MEELKVESDDGGQIPVIELRGEDATGPALVIFPAIFGVDEGTLELARSVAEAGCTVWAVDFYWRTVPGMIPPDRFQEALDRAVALNREQVQADVAAVVAALRGRGAGRVAVVGVCFGGPFALAAAAAGVADAALTFHGSRLDTVLDRLGAVRCPVSLHFGELDGAADEALRTRLSEALAHNPQARLHLHRGARHGFAIPGHGGHQYQAQRASWSDLVAMMASLTTS